MSVEQLTQAIKLIDTLGKLKLSGQIYAFSTEDTLNERQGIELYLRQGDSFKEYLVMPNRNSVYSAENAAGYLSMFDISKVYTGQIPIDGSFLDLHNIRDQDDPIITSIMDNSAIRVFELSGIEVVKLDYLI